MNIDKLSQDELSDLQTQVDNKLKVFHEKEQKERKSKLKKFAKSEFFQKIKKEMAAFLKKVNQNTTEDLAFVVVLKATKHLNSKEMLENWLDDSSLIGEIEIEGEIKGDVGKKKKAFLQKEIKRIADNFCGTAADVLFEDLAVDHFDHYSKERDKLLKKLDKVLQKEVGISMDEASDMNVKEFSL